MVTTLSGQTGARAQPLVGLGSRSVPVHARTLNQSTADSRVGREIWELTLSPRNVTWEIVQVSIFGVVYMKTRSSVLMVVS